jgi:hypothetical protein
LYGRKDICNKNSVVSNFSESFNKKIVVFSLWIILFSLCFVLSSNLRAQAEVTVTGSWSLNISVADLLGGPGSPLNNTYESLIDEIIIDIEGKKVNGWILYVRRSDITWNSNFRLNIRRTSDGSAGGGTVTGGTTYQEITTSDTEFFRGDKKLRGIENQLQLQLLSGVVNSGTYQTTVIYTVTDM